MVKVIVVYDTKYGNTKLVAEKIVEGIREAEGIETAISDVEEVNIENVADYDAILIGSPNHIGGPVRGIKKLIDKLGKLEGEMGSCFRHLSGRRLRKSCEENGEENKRKGS